MNSIAREKLVAELEHLLRHKPAMGTLFLVTRETNHMLIVTQENGVISLAYPYAGRLDIFRARRFTSFCKTRGLSVRTALWWKTKVSSALIGPVATDAAQTIAECFAQVYRVSGPFGLNMQGMGWQASGQDIRPEPDAGS